MADPVKKTAKKGADAKKPKGSTGSGEELEEEYELMPHRDIVELREELRKLKSLPPEAGRHTEASFEELTKRMDSLIEIFEEAEKTVRIEEGASTFKEKMAPIVEKMNTILKQNSEIAEGIVALADIMSEIKEKLEVGVIYKAKEAEKVEPVHMPRPAPMPAPAGPAPGAPMPPPKAPAPAPGGPMPPPLPRPGAPMPPPGAAPMPGPMPAPPGAAPAAPPKKKGLFGR
jgi:hypothetical protein